jgi:hypothetical protein
MRSSVIRAGIKANRYIRANRDGTVRFLTEWLKLNREAAAATYDSVVRVYNEDVNVCDKGLRVVIDETKKTMKLSRDVAYRRLPTCPAGRAVGIDGQQRNNQLSWSSIVVNVDVKGVTMISKL